MYIPSQWGTDKNNQWGSRIVGFVDFRDEVENEV